MRESILHLIDSFEQGGTERQAVQLARLLKDSGRYRVLLACFDRRGALRDEAESIGLGEIAEFPLTSFRDLNAARQLRRFARHLRREGVRLVHTHGFYTNTFGMLGATLARVPARVASRREMAAVCTPAQKRAERLAVFPLARAVVVNADAVRGHLVREGVPADKIVTVYNGLDAARLAPTLGREEALRHFGLPPSGRRFVTIVANLNHRVKDQTTFLRAARRVREAVSDASFVVAGEGRLADEYRALAAELGIGAEVFFTGDCRRVGDLLAVSDVCVLSSRSEGFSNSILEYMAAARPVVVTDVGGAREAVEEGRTGHIVAPGDDAAMAARLVALLEDPERARRMGELGRRVVAEKFSCEAQLARTEALYESLLERRPLPHPAAGLRSEGA
jgi:glycosyltransferase involved in cell wall biosynthesis